MQTKQVAFDKAKTNFEEAEKAAPAETQAFKQTQTAADTAKTAADNAKTATDNADNIAKQTKAAADMTAAGNAKTAYETVKTAYETAKTAASNAKKAYDAKVNPDLTKARDTALEALDAAKSELKPLEEVFNGKRPRT